MSQVPDVRDPRFKALEQQLPNPLARPIKRYRDIPVDDHAARFKRLIELGELIVAFTATIAAKRTLSLGMPSEEIREYLSKLTMTSFGAWLHLLRATLKPGEKPRQPEEEQPLAQLRDWFDRNAGREPGVAEASARLIELFQLQVKQRGKLPHSVLLERINQVRNAHSHVPGFSALEMKEAADALAVLVEQLFSGLSFLSSYPVAFVDDVRIVSGDSWLGVRVGRGTEFERLDVASPEALHDRRLYLVRFGSSGTVEFALDLSPYALFRPCDVCRTEQVFIFNKLARQAIQYASWSCGHTISVDDPAGEFRNIEDFLAGRIGLASLFEGKALGMALPEGRRSVSRVQREQAVKLVEVARAKLLSGAIDSAIDAASRALAIDPDSGEAYHLLGLAALLVDAPKEEVQAHLAEAVRLSPADRAARISLGRVAELYGDLTDARIAYTEALSYDPANAEVRERLAELLQQDDRSVTPDGSSRAAMVQEVLAHDPLDISGLEMWCAVLPPWRWLVPAPTLRSGIFALGSFALATATVGPSIEPLHIGWFAVISAIIFLGCWVPFAVPRLLRTLFQELRGAVTLPAASFRRWFQAELVPFIGSAHALNEGERWTVGAMFRRDRFLAWALVLWAFLFWPMQMACANGGDPFEGTAPKLARYVFYTTQVWVLAWIPPFVWRSLTFIPGFVHLPIRHFVAAPDQATLKPLGSFYLKVSFLASMCGFLVTLQHYLFRTHETVPLFSLPFQVVTVLMVISFVFVSQVLIIAAMERLRQRRLVEFSYYVEAAFDRFLRVGTPEAFEALTERRDQARFLRRSLRLGGLSSWAKFGLAALALAQAAVVGAYVWSIVNDALPPALVIG